jgi:hypothetical protein
MPEGAALEEAPNRFVLANDRANGLKAEGAGVGPVNRF